MSPGFFGAFGGRLVEGRDFTDADTPDRPPVAIVNETFARTLLGGNALGRRIRSGASGAWVEIVGIARDGKYQSLGEDPTAVAFHSARQWYNPSTVIVARTSLDERSALDAARRMVHEIDPHLSVFADRPLRVLLALPLLPTQAAATLLGLFGALAIVMVLVGTYGVTAYAVAQRAREISIRIAIGASAPQVVRLVLGRGLVVWVVGMLAGLALAFVGAPLLRPILLGVAPRDPAVLATAVAIAAAVTCAAVWQPARRAIATSPSTLLRVR